MSRKNLFIITATLLLSAIITACGQSTATASTATPAATIAATPTPLETAYVDITPEIVYVTPAPTESYDLIDQNMAAYAGTYTSENGDTLTIDASGNVNISIIRLCSMQGTASGAYKGILPITVTDPNGNPMGLEFNTETKQLYVTDSQWSYLANGDTFSLDR